MPKFSFPGRIPFNSVAISYSNKNFPVNKNINNNIKNFSNIKNLKNISQINYPNLKGWAKFKVSIKISSIKFSIKFNNAKFPYYIKFNNAKFPYYIKFIKTNNVIGARQLQEAKPERNCLTNHQHCSFQGGANTKMIFKFVITA